MTAELFDRGGLERVIAVINGEGGVLKTILTANVAGLLATVRIAFWLSIWILRAIWLRTSGTPTTAEMTRVEAWRRR